MYQEHFHTVLERTQKALEHCGYDQLIIHSGSPVPAFLDDQSYPYRANPHFLYWVPLTNFPDSFVVVSTSEKPKLVLLQPIDFWHTAKDVPEGAWLELFDIISVATLDEAERLLSAKANTAWIGDTPAMATRWGYESSINPPALLNYLHYDRAYKTEWEIEQLTQANRLAGIAHTAARDAYLSGASEIEIHLAYLTSIKQCETELPYSSIVALNEHGAILHYDQYQRKAPDAHRAFLIDAGARVNGYVADITRTWTTDDDFQTVIDAIDRAQLELIEEFRIGEDYASYHYAMHHRLAIILAEHKLINCSPESAVDNGITKAFFPHGLGHLIGLQTHDIGGHQLDRSGTIADTNDGHPFLRLRRKLEANTAITVEPGCYVIPELLKPFTGSSELNWDRIEWLRQFGGVRIEDTVVVTTDGPKNLTRPFV